MRGKKDLSFGEWRARTERKDTVNECSLLGLFAGALLFLCCGYRALCEIGIREALFCAGAALGVLLFLIGAFFPLLLRFPMQQIKRGTRFLGKQLLRILMLPVFMTLWLVSLFTKKKAERKYPFNSWADGENVPEPAFSSFLVQEYRSSGNAVFSVINNLLLFLSRNRFLFLLPILLLLLLIGIAFFFASSEAAFTFIYTLF